MRKLTYTLLFYQLLYKCACIVPTVPVLMIDENYAMSRLTHKADPFTKISSELFTRLANEVMNRADCVIIFVEEKLSMEDFSTKDRSGTPYVHMQKSLVNKQVVFFPSVSEPLEILHKTFAPHASNIHHVALGNKMEMIEEKKYLYVYFDDGLDMKRTDKLRKHDAIIKDIYFTVRRMKRGPVVGFYTGKSNRISTAQMRSVPKRYYERSNERGVLVATPDALFRLTGVFATSYARRSTFGHTPIVDAEIRTRRSLSTTMRYMDVNLQFNFYLGAHKWELVNIMLLEAGEVVGRTVMNVEIPWHRSYFCREPIIIYNERDNSFITIPEYQIEPFPWTRSRRHTSEAKNNKFSDSVSCGPYFNTPIISGVMVTFMFFLISGWGLMMLMNCQTHDRYDDPNQKPLVIASETGGGFS